MKGGTTGGRIAGERSIELALARPDVMPRVVAREVRLGSFMAYHMWFTVCRWEYHLRPAVPGASGPPGCHGPGRLSSTSWTTSGTSFERGTHEARGTAVEPGEGQRSGHSGHAPSPATTKPGSSLRGTRSNLRRRTRARAGDPRVVQRAALSSVTPRRPWHPSPASDADQVASLFTAKGCRATTGLRVRRGSPSGACSVTWYRVQVSLLGGLRPNAHRGRAAQAAN